MSIVCVKHYIVITGLSKFYILIFHNICCFETHADFEATSIMCDDWLQDIL